MKKLIVVLLIIGLGVGAFFGIKSFFKKDEPVKTVEQPKEIVYKLVEIERMSELPGKIEAKGEKEWLVVTVNGVNYDTVKRLYNMYYFTFEDEEGDVYDNSPNSLTDAIIYGELAPKGSVTGSIVFKVDKGDIGKLIISDEKYQEVQTLNIK